MGEFYSIKQIKKARKGKVLQLLNGKVIKIWKSQREAYRSLNIQQSALSQALNGKIKTAYGFEWKYENSELLESDINDTVTIKFI